MAWILFSAASPVGAQPVEESDDVKIAVPAMRLTGVDEILGPTLTEIITVETSEMEGISVIAASDIVAMIGFESEKELLGCSDDVSCIAEIGGALGVDLLLVSDLGKVGKSYVLNLKLVDTAKVTVLKRIYKVVTGEADALIETVRTSLPVLLSVVTGETPAAGDEPATTAAPSTPETPAAAATATTSAEAPTRWPQYTLMIGGGLVLLVGGLTWFSAYPDGNWAGQSTTIAGTEVHSHEAYARYDGAATRSRIGLGLTLVGVLVTGGGLLWRLLTPDPAPAVAIGAVPTSDGLALGVGGSF